MRLITKYRLVLGFFILGLVLSGLTAFPLGIEIHWLRGLFGANHSTGESPGGLFFWISTVDQGVQATYTAYPWIAYGTDWLAFAHIAIAVYFVGPMINPIRNEWVIHAGLIGCALVLPLALVCGPIRGIPFYWRLIDCSFGFFGAVPLLYCMYLTGLMKKPVPHDALKPAGP